MRIEPCLVNLMALLTRLMRICFTLPPSPRSERGSSGARSIVELDALGCGLDGEHLLELVERRPRVERILDELESAGLDLDISSTSLRSVGRCLPLEWMVPTFFRSSSLSDRVALEELRVQQDHAQGGADLVGHMGEKLALGRVRALGVILGLAELARARRDELLEPLAVGAELGQWRRPPARREPSTPGRERAPCRARRSRAGRRPRTAPAPSRSRRGSRS